MKGYLKWQDAAKILGSSASIFLAVVVLLNLAGMEYSIPPNITCGTDCYSEIRVNSTFWAIKVEHSGDSPILYKKMTRSRTLWLNLDRIEEIIPTNPEVEIEILVPTIKKYSTLKHPEFGYLRPIKDGDYLIERYSQKYNPDGDRFIIHGKKEAFETVKWGLNLEHWLSEDIKFDPYWYGVDGKFEILNSFTDRTCYKGHCTAEIGSPRYILNKTGMYEPFSKVVKMKWQGATNTFNVSKEGDWWVRIEPFVIYNGNYKTVADIKNAFPAVDIKDYVSFTQNYKHKWGLNYSAVPDPLLANVDYLGFRLLNSKGLTWNDVKREGNYRISIKGEVFINYRDLKESAFTLNFVNKTYLLIGNISANVENGVLYLDPLVELENPGYDCHVNQDDPNGNAGDSIYLYAYNATGGADEMRAMVKFNLSTIPNNSIINSARIDLNYQYVVGSGESGLNASAITNYTWHENSTTWNHNKDDFDKSTTVQNLSKAETAGDWQNFTITSMMQTWVDDKDVNGGVMIMLNRTPTGANCYHRFYSQNHPTEPGPRAVIDYSPPAGITYGQFEEKWETSRLSDNWTVHADPGRDDNITVFGTVGGQAPFEGSYQLFMSSGRTANNYEDISITTRYNFTNGTAGTDMNNIILTFAQREWSDEADQCSASWTGFTDGECASFTCDGVTFYRIIDLSAGGISNSTYAHKSANISADSNLCSEINETFAVRIQWYDNYGLTSDGMVFDNITVTYNGIIGGELPVALPQFSNNNVNGTATGSDVNFSITVNDTAMISSYIFSSNISDTWENDSAVTVYGQFLTLDNITAINNAANSVIGWRFFANDTGNNWNASAIHTLIVTGLFPTEIKLWFNDTQGNLSVNYGNEINVSAELNVTGPITFWFNDTNITAADTSFVFVLNKSNLQVGTVNVSASYSGNSTHSSTMTTNYTITYQSNTSVNLLLNGTDSNKDYVQWMDANFTVVANVSGFTVYLDSNYTGWVIQSGTTPLMNYTNVSLGGKWNMTGYYIGNVNYTRSSETHYANVGNISVTILYLNGSSVDRWYESGEPVNFTCTIDDGKGNLVGGECTLTINNSVLGTNFANNSFEWNASGNGIMQFNDSSYAKNLTYASAGNQTVWMSLHAYDRIINASWNFTGFQSGGVDPTNVKIFINGSLSNFISGTLVEGDQNISNLNDSSSAKNITFPQLGSSNTTYLNLPQNAIMTNAQINLSGFKQEVGWTYDEWNFSLGIPTPVQIGFTMNGSDFWVLNYSSDHSPYEDEIYIYDSAGTYKKCINLTTRWTVDLQANGTHYWIFEAYGDTIKMYDMSHTLKLSFIPSEMDFEIDSFRNNGTHYFTLEDYWVNIYDSAGTYVGWKKELSHVFGPFERLGYWNGDFWITETSYDIVYQFDENNFTYNGSDNFYVGGEDTLGRNTDGNGTHVWLYGTGYIYRYAKTYPKNPYLDVGEDADQDWNFTEIFEHTQNRTANFSSEITDFLSACTPDSLGFCDVPLVLHSGRGGKIQIDDIEVNYTLYFNPIELNKKIINSYLVNSSGYVKLSINISSESAGIIQIDEINFTHYGSSVYNITAYFAGNGTYAASKDEQNINIIYSNYTRGLPYTWTEDIAFYPFTNSSKRVEPWGQTNDIPIYNITWTNYKRNATLAIRVNVTQDCINYTAGNTTNYTVSAFNLTTNYQRIYTNSSYDSTNTTNIWLWADYYNCNATQIYVVRRIDLKSCCDICMSCW